MTSFLLPWLRARGHAVLASLMDGHDYTDDVADDDVTFGLDRILDGIGMVVAEKRAPERAARGRRGARE
ncbi:hypothetical protein [Streptomyces sp. NRRL F-5630]|uniref:hypothetical protein n=1 Tax=Streptomyces sp. NRRL F-5630 TaxID=1463864 RepID=UPI0004C9F39D|nr:hypothetical protein [Streptomyces sp. NRRL F-5630]